MAIRIGISTGLAALNAAKDYWRWADFCEASAIDSIWPSDQLLGPTLEPMTLLAALAARTSRLKFGTNALVLPFRDPLVIAKQFAAIEHLGSGRLFPVIGVGANSDPYWQATGSSPKGRGSRANEALALLRRLLDEEEVQFEGAHYRFSGPGVRPRPSRRIPIWIGGNSQAAVTRTAALGDGWLGSFADAASAGATRRAIEAALAQTGRTIASDHYGMSLLMRVGDPDDPAVAQTRRQLGRKLAESGEADGSDLFAVGSVGDVISTLRRYVDEGMSKFVALPMASDTDDLMEQTRLLATEILPAVEDR